MFYYRNITLFFADFFTVRLLLVLLKYYKTDNSAAELLSVKLYFAVLSQFDLQHGVSH